MFRRRKVMGLIMLSMGTGMLLALLIPVWGYVIAVGLVAGGIYYFFL